MKLNERKQFDKQPVVVNKVNQISGKNKQVNTSNKGSYRNEVFQGNVQIKRDSQREWERPFERKKPIICYYCNEVGHIKPSCPRLTKNNVETVDNIKVNSGNEEPFRNSEFQGTSQIRGSEREWERPFEREKPIISYYCNEVGHNKPACPKLLKTDFKTVASLRVYSEDEDGFEKFKVKFEINGVERQCLRDTGSTIDLCTSSWIDENDYLRLMPLDDVCHRLPLAKVKFKTKGGEFYTKTAVKVNSHPSEPYLLSNHTAKLIQSREKSVMIDAMVTRNASKIVPFEKERKAGLNAASNFSIENADPVFPTQGNGTEPTKEFPAFVEK
ncbi:hypothetical protein TNCV_2647981 [Trichonephila clavipes]|nr:hypothetical protein TNCV_2647981 [Trichonephila clavipes]